MAKNQNNNEDLKQQQREQKKEEMFRRWEDKLSSKKNPTQTNENNANKNKTKSLLPLLILITLISVLGLIAFITIANDSINEIKEDKRINIQKKSLIKKFLKSDADVFLKKAQTSDSGNKYQIISLGAEQKINRNTNIAKVSYNIKWLDENGNISYTDEALQSEFWSYFNSPSSWFEAVELIGIGGQVELYCPIESVIFRDTETPNQAAFLIEIKLEGILPLDNSPQKEVVAIEAQNLDEITELYTIQNTTIRKCPSLFCDVLGLIPKNSPAKPMKDEKQQSIIENNWIKVEYTGRFCNNAKDKNCSSRSAVNTVEGWVVSTDLKN